ncbi:hypothetical protein F1559_000863 [Cyanidiococcus yangmingshanensis]|uniref:ABC transmembrane type-1 domain-containing protein n=1 Tax=Cyanidiococcus yangmingshanensis TaxID=2690220 RepID=A0A7J7IRY6_9RHOD|nr:hypothetical protein F1559_000863 [Cyanidiococcus yangmingshanensis]
MVNDHRTWAAEDGSSSDEHNTGHERQQQLGPATQLGDVTRENEFLNEQLIPASDEEHVWVKTFFGEPRAGLSGTVSGSEADSLRLVPANETQAQHEPAQPAKPSLDVDQKTTDTQLSVQAVDDSRWTAPDADQGLSSDDEPPAYVPRNFATAAAANNKRASDASDHFTGDEMESAQISSLDDYIRMRRARPADLTEEGSKPPIRERSGFSNKSAQAESNSSSSKLQSIGKRVAKLVPGPVSDTTRDVLDSFKQLIWEPPLIAPSQSSIFWEYYADAVYGIYPEGSRYERETSESNANEPGSPRAVEERHAPASTMDDDLNAKSQKSGEQSARKHRRFCGLCYCCGFSLWTCTAAPEIDRRRTAKLQSIANLLSPHQWLMNGVFSFLRGIIAALAAGAILPAYLYLFAHVIDYWSDIDFGLLRGEPQKSLHYYLIGFGVVTVAAVTSLFFQSRFLGTIGRAARYRLRLWSFAALLQTTGVNTDRLDRYLFEQNTLEQMETLVFEAVEHFSATLTYAAQIVTCFIIGMTESWFLTLVLLGVTPILAAVGVLQMVLTRAALRRYAQAAQNTREFLSNVRAALPNIVLHDQFQKEFQKLYELTDTERKYDSRLNLLQSVLRGLTFGFVLATFAVLGIYLGGHLARNKHRSSGQLAAAVLLSMLLMASILKLTENLLRYLGSRRRLFVYLDFVLDLVDESQTGLGSVLRVDERSVSIIFREVSVSRRPERLGVARRGRRLPDRR